MTFFFKVEKSLSDFILLVTVDTIRGVLEYRHKEKGNGRTALGK